MRKFMKIVESVTNDISLNSEIEAKISSFDEDERVMVRDIIELLDTRKTVHISDIMAHTDMLGYPASRVSSAITNLLRLFPNMLTRSGNELTWGKVEQEDTPMDPTMRMAMSQQIEILHRLISDMERMPSFTLDDVKENLYAHGLPHMVADMFAEHFITNFTGTAKINPDGSFTIPKTTTKSADDYINGWKNDARKS